MREVHEALSNRHIGYTPVLKQMQVMVEKGLLTRNERFRSHVYSAKHPPERTRRKLVMNLLQKAFAGSAKNLVLGALSAQPVSRSELEEIKRAIADFERNQAQ